MKPISQVQANSAGFWTNQPVVIEPLPDRRAWWIAARLYLYDKMPQH
jgi:hypothetical protein